MVYCVAVNCTNSSSGGIPCKFFTFPKDKKLRKAWVVKIKRENFIPSKFSRLCNVHFEDTCFIRSPTLYRSLGIDSYRLQLKENALPTIFNFNPSQASTPKPSTATSSSPPMKRRHRQQIIAEIEREPTASSSSGVTSHEHVCSSMVDIHCSDANDEPPIHCIAAASSTTEASAILPEQLPAPATIRQPPVESTRSATPEVPHQLPSLPVGSSSEDIHEPCHKDASAMADIHVRVHYRSRGIQCYGPLVDASTQTEWRLTPNMGITHEGVQCSWPDIPSQLVTAPPVMVHVEDTDSETTDSEVDSNWSEETESDVIDKLEYYDSDAIPSDEYVI